MMAHNANPAIPVKILLVDDEEEFVHTLAERLEARGLEPSVAYDGEQALYRVKAEEPEIMVLDLRMPGMHGMEVLRHVKRDHPDVQVIILTGHGSDADRELSEELGAFAYLQKPVKLNRLVDVMKAAYLKLKGRPWSTEG
jgi:two-component system response regulator CpxR